MNRETNHGPRNERPTGRRLILGSAFILVATLTACGPGAEDPSGHDAHQPAPAEPSATHDHGDGMVRIGADMARRLGVTLVEARRETLERDLRAPGEVVWDETRLTTVSLRFGGWAEHLHADFTGRFVEAGTPLLDVYSPQLVAAQEDLLSALRLTGALEGSRVPTTVDRSERVLEASRERLRRWQVSEADIRHIEETGEVRESLTLVAPSSGYVVEKNIQAGERFESGATLYRLADLSTVWIEVEVYEDDLRFVRLRDEMEVTISAYPGESYRGEVAYIHPDVDRQRRTTRVRIELPNPGHTLRPGMYGSALTRIEVARDALTVPRDAVMHTGERAVVFVAHGDDQYMVHEVEVGAEAGGRTQILSGLEAGAMVVARSGFILDAESRLMEAMMGQPGMPGMEGMEMEMDMEGTDMDMEDPEMPGMDMDPDPGPGNDDDHGDSGADDTHDHGDHDQSHDGVTDTHDHDDHDPPAHDGPTHESSDA